MVARVCFRHTSNYLRRFFGPLLAFEELAMGLKKLVRLFIPDDFCADFGLLLGLGCGFERNVSFDELREIPSLVAAIDDACILRLRSWETPRTSLSLNPSISPAARTHEPSR